MPTDIPSDLITAVREGRAVLFMGAGASRGATDGRGGTPPDGKKLASLLAEAFLGEGYDGFDLRSVYDLACSERDVRTVQKKIKEILDPFIPADFHKIIPTFPWAGLATTNYDLIIERAYAKPATTAKLIPYVKDGDGATDKLAGDTLLYVKLHGCITRYQEVNPPLVASTEQLIAFNESRKGQFDLFLEWAKNKTVIFCGYSFMDMNLRTLFDEIIKEGDNRPRHYIVNKGARPAEIGYWRDRRVIALDIAFEEFLVELDKQISENERTLGSLAALTAKTSFSKFITTPGSAESDDLRRYIGSLIEHVSDEMPIETGDPKRFYSGFDLGWYPYSAQLDITQPAVSEVIREYVERSSALMRLPIILIKGHAGSGKTVSLRRICYDAATRHDRLCFFASKQHKIVPERFEEIFSLTNVPIYLFIDGIADHRRDIVEVIKLAKRRTINLKIIACESFNTWNVLCDDLEPFVGNLYEMRYLSEANIQKLLGKLEAHHCLGYLANIPENKRADELKDIHGRQILVALLEATHGAPLVEIIVSEYQSIQPAEARRIYLDICSLHRFGPPVRAGLISRVHNISFEDFQERFFKPLEAIVVLKRDKKSGDYVYEARHSFIASELYDAVLPDQEDRFDNLVRIVNKLNPAFSYDQEVMSRLIRSENLRATLSDLDRIRQVYDVAIAAFGETAAICHQRGVFELSASYNSGDIARAEEWLIKANEKDQFNRSIRHSLAELDLKRSRLSDNQEDRVAWRAAAVKQATALISGSTSPYPYHTLLKAAIDGVKDAMDGLEGHAGEEETRTLSEAIAHAETTLKRGRQAFPNEAVLLSEEGQLSTILAQGNRAESAFEKAFEANPRSTLLAKRLARIKRARDSYDEAAVVLRRCLEHNPGSAELHYDLAMTMIEGRPDGDQQDLEDVLYHLRRSFTPGDNNLQAQFWYARQLAIAGHYQEARPIFKRLEEASLPYREKTEVRGILLDASGAPVEKLGIVSLWRETWGFMTIEELEMQVFLPLTDALQEIYDYVTVGTTLRFNLGFTLRGPIALDPRL